jgi:hypothetical protein
VVLEEARPEHNQRQIAEVRRAVAVVVANIHRELEHLLQVLAEPKGGSDDDR